MLVLDRICERWYVRALLALARRDRDHALVESLVPRLDAIERELAGPTTAPADRTSALATRLALSRTARDLLGAAIAFSLDPRIAPHAEALGGPVARRGLSIAVFAELAGLSPDDGRALVIELGGDHPAIAAGILAVGDDTVPASARPYRVPHRVLAHLVGDDRIDPELQLVTVDPAWVHDIAQSDAIDALGRALAGTRPLLVVVEGPAGTGKRSALACAAHRTLVVLDAERCGRAGLERGLVALGREALLLEAVPVIANVDALVGEGRHPLAAFLERQRGPFAMTSTRAGIDLGVDRPTARIAWRYPDADVRRRLWAQHAVTATRGHGVRDAELEPLADRYRLGPGTIARAVASAEAMHEAAPLDGKRLAAGLRHNIAERMGGLAHRIEVTQRWDDVVLADDTLDQVHALIARVRHGRKVLDDWGYRSKIARGTGVAALFSGPPGTGKTMVSGLVARELDLELYQVDLSQVVSKWVGETEKQLARIFDAAEEGHALLLFDEADSLFGQRSADVKSAVDRYANLEVNFLLQRIEAFGGITILTTNLDNAIDRALKRRLAGHIVFAAPDDEERQRLWQVMTSTGSAPLAPGVDFTALARQFPTMTGANIRNAVLSAAYLAAAESARHIEEAHLVRAARAEYRSMGHVLAEQGRRP
ncbi:MAG TPA: ATP-binding protein [Kofleriaceae bacterium]|nr:ATP-binding protein [Kofleriaceae bacterium]